MHRFLTDISRVVLLIYAVLRFGTAPLLQSIFRRGAAYNNYPKRIRLILERMGLTYLKLGQFLAMRYDILPAEVCKELSRLFENVPPIKFAEVKTVIESELQKPLSEAFSSFESQPIASATVAQVHIARTHDNIKTAVKIQRPGIEQIFNSDMRNLNRVAILVDKLGLFGKMSFCDAVDEFERYTRRELDFRLEGQTAERLHNHALPYEVIPKIFWQLSGRKVLTMEFIDGISLAKLSDMIVAGEHQEIKQILPELLIEQSLHNLAFVTLHQLFSTGFFHADPHPGNIIMLGDNRVCLVDFGIFGELSTDQQGLLATYVENLALGNVDESARFYCKLTVPTKYTNYNNYYKDVRSVLSSWYEASNREDTPLKDKHLGKYAGMMFELIRQHQVRMSMDTLLFWRALISLDASALRLSVHFDLIKELRSFFEQSRPGFVRKTIDILTDENLLVQLPDLCINLKQNTANVISDIRSGHYVLDAESSETPKYRLSRDREVKAIVLALIGVSQLIIALASYTELIKILTFTFAATLFIWSILTTRAV